LCQRVSNGKRQSFVLLNQIYNTLGIIVKLIVFVPCNSQQIVKLDKNHLLDDIYNDKAIVLQAITRRVQCKEWALPDNFKNGKGSEDKKIEKFANSLFPKSKANLHFAQMIMEQANAVFGFPIITSQNYNNIKLDFSLVLPEIVMTSGLVEIAKVKQVRVLILINNMTIGHITWMYSADDDITCSLSDHHSLLTMYAKEIPGIIVTMTSNNDDKIIFAVPIESIHDDKTTHITMDPGIHEAKEIRSVVKQLNENKKIVQIPTKNGTLVNYNTIKMIKEKCTIKVLGTFGL